MSISFNMVANGAVPATGATPGAQYYELNAAGDGFVLYNTPADGVPIPQEAINADAAQALIDASLDVAALDYSVQAW